MDLLAFGEKIARHVEDPLDGVIRHAFDELLAQLADGRTLCTPFFDDIGKQLFDKRSAFGDGEDIADAVGDDEALFRTSVQPIDRPLLHLAAVTFIRFFDVLDRDRIGAAFRARFDQMPARNGHFEGEEISPLLLCEQFLVDIERDFGKVGVDADARRRFVAINVAAAGKVDEGLPAPARLVDVEGVLFYLAVVSYKPLVILARIARLSRASAAKSNMFQT